MEKVQISAYTGYKHNRYDGYNCSWGVLMALGASQKADAFANRDDYPNASFDAAYNGKDPKIGNGDNDDFRETVLANLDQEDVDAINDMENDDMIDFCEYWGQYPIHISVTKTANGLTCVFDGHGPFEVTV